MPVPAEKASRREKLVVLLPCQGLLFAALAGMTAAASRLRATLLAGPAEGAATARMALVDFPTGLNAAWLGAASGVGLMMTCQQLPVLRGLTSPGGSAALLGSVALGNLSACVLFGQSAPALSLGYGLATSWACHGIGRNDTLPPTVRRSARLLRSTALATSVLVQLRSLMAPTR